MCFLLVRFLEINTQQSPKFSQQTCLYSLLLKRSLFQKKNFWVFKKLFLIFFFLILETISYKNIETCTPCPFIQCWLQVCFLIPGHHCLAQFFRTWHNIEPGEGAILGIFERVLHFYRTFHENIVSLNNFCDWLQVLVIFEKQTL